MRARGVSAAFAISFILLAGLTARAVGLDLGCEVVLIDLTGAYPKVSTALEASADVLLGLAGDQGTPPSELAALETTFNAGIANVVAALATFPRAIPVPLLGAGLEIPLPWIVVDALRLSGGCLDSSWARSLARVAGVVLPEPLLEQILPLGAETARFALDADALVWAIAADGVKRFDLWIAALSLSAGLGYSAGALAVNVEREVPVAWEGGVDSAVAALHLADLRWAALAARLGARLELGLPFFRIYAEARLVAPLAEWIGWWDLRVAGWAGAIGVVIRF
ncbi:MAG: hypothetical protein AB1778_01040 [Candidatus Bipolaricaulota bacterium]